MLRTIALTGVSILLGLAANYDISVACCPPLDGFNIAGDDASTLRFAVFPEIY